MDYNKMADEVFKDSQDLKYKAQALVFEVRIFIDDCVDTYADFILKCEKEDDFLKFLAAIGDKFYKGNAITEQFDGFAFVKILQVLDKHALDRFLGADWFERLKEKAKLISEATDPNEGLPNE